MKVIKIFFELALTIIILISISAGCKNSSSTEPPNNSNEKLREQFQLLLNNAVASDSSIHNMVLLVDAPNRNLKWKGAAGKSNPNTGPVMNANDQFRIASLGKMTLATVVMKFVEENRFKLEDSIYHYLPDSIMTGLHVFQGNDYSRQITIRQLLSHSSGLPDYIEDGNKNVNGLTDFLLLLMNQPNKFWTPEETIEYAKLHLTPLFIPGTGYHYSDANYQLLGLILQKISGKSLNVLYHEKLFAPLQMNRTYMEYYDEPVPGITGYGLSHCYYGEIDYTGWKSNSADWAGGGLVSCTEDLNNFFSAFVDDKIFKNCSTKEQMLQWRMTGETGTYYGLGVAKINLSEFGLPEIGDIYGHDGFPQSFMFYCPKQNVRIIGTLNQAVSEYHYQQLVLEALNILQNKN